MGDGAQPPNLLNDACSSFDLEQADMPAFSLSKLPNIDTAFASLTKLPSIDGLTTFTKLPSTDALDFLTNNNNNNIHHPTIPMPSSISTAGATQQARAQAHSYSHNAPATPHSHSHPHPHPHQHATPTTPAYHHPHQEDDAASVFSMLSPRTVAEAPGDAPPLRLGGSVGAAAASGMGRGGMLKRGAPSGGASTIGLASPDAEAKRLQHNRMMRENRERANRKFNALEALLLRCACADVARGPMRNKMQVLDRAMAQYPAMCARRAELRASLVTSASTHTHTQSPLPLTVPLTAPDTLARLLLAAHGWKAAEVWRAGRVHTALLAAKNMLPTAAQLRVFCAVRAAAAAGRGPGGPDPLVAKAASLGSNVWVPDLRVHADTATANAATQAQVSTALYVPITEAVLVLFHADDDLLPYPGQVRPYDADTLAAVDELARPLRIA